MPLIVGRTLGQPPPPTVYGLDGPPTAAQHQLPFQSHSGLRRAESMACSVFPNATFAAGPSNTQSCQAKNDRELTRLCSKLIVANS
uniref:Uncharacterized protein n=1 Tax=Panagrellus redivivus TaxID=6233 RepID=A0A7E4V8Q9_PANRE